ncbi:OmpA family protein [Flavobacterium dankookense]|uniref:Outer membrane protein OmpA-like peptidoglycan-associated protein n=1 Tax=Flavobacterium dankookense TaxID=706186 RepID=A0A4R6QD16_9FLAO|nr:OmpA family protein [Flavobacterium dankookense]TDP60265.1 outer membrane protein OmpA-like peptidoglycan-associated protein [Flavobacterium dankookense]
MKNLYIALSFAVGTLTISAQNKDTKTADKLYKRYEYVDAAKEYLKLVENGKSDGYVYKQLADTYYNMFNPDEAAKWYAKAVETTQDAETHYRYAQMLKANGKYEESNKQMQKFASMSPSDSRAKAFKENPNYVPRILSKAKAYNVNSLDISTDKSEFGPVLYDNAFYFTSARNGARKNYGWTDEPFLDIYRADYNEDATITNASTVTSLNSKWHDGPVTISADGNTAYFASDSFRESSFLKDKENKLKLGKNSIYKATKTGDTWGNITLLPFNSKEYSCANPSLSRDGKTLYFSSNMPNSIGGVDIWKVAVKEDGTFGTPENLGSKVNTEGNETFPYIADDNKTLFFASSGRPGLGGLDVFEIDLTSGEASNMGKPVNSEKDDFSFSFNSKKNVGFLASNRNGNDDIFGAIPVCGVDVITVVTDAKTGAILSGAKVAILDDKKNVITTETTTANGEIKYRVECDMPYVVQVSKDGYEGNTFAVAKSKGPTAKVDAALQPIDVIVTPTEIVLKPIFFEYDKSNITQEGAFELDKLVQVMKNNDKLVILAKSHTDNRGTDRYNINLSDRRAKSTVQYIISKGIDASRISGKGMGELEPKVDCGADCTEEQHAQNRRSEFLIVK